MTELKPCPFCGGEATDESCDRVGVISCKACDYRIHGDGILSAAPNDHPIPYSDGNGGVLPASEVKHQEYYHAENKQQMADKWNTRHVDDELSMLKSLVSELIDDIDDRDIGAAHKTLRRHGWG